MNKMNLKTFLSLFLCAVLIAAMALFASGCGDKTAPSGAALSGGDLGEGATEFTFLAADLEGNETTFHIHTDKTLVGEALQELGLIEGEEGDFGLYVKTVNGLTLDYDKDGAYWAFYIDGEYAMSGVDVTEIVPGTTYEMRAEKA